MERVVGNVTVFLRRKINITHITETHSSLPFCIYLNMPISAQCFSAQTRKDINSSKCFYVQLSPNDSNTLDLT